MIDSAKSTDTSEHIDRLIQIGRQAVRNAQQQSREMGVANVYSINGKLYYETSTGELSATDPLDNGHGNDRTIRICPGGRTREFSADGTMRRHFPPLRS